MAEDRADNSTQRRLNAAFEASDQVEWSAEDLAAILEHQLDAPLLSDLQKHFPDLANELRASKCESPEKLSIAEILRNGKLELLQIVKTFSKRLAKATGLPDAIGVTLYYACICSAQSRFNVTIHSLSEADLDKGIDWALDQPWLTPELRTLLKDCR